MISDETARCLVKDGVLEKTLEGKDLGSKEKSDLYEQALLDWATTKRASMEMAKKIKQEKKAREEGVAEGPAKERPLGT